MTPNKSAAPTPIHTAASTSAESRVTNTLESPAKAATLRNANAERPAAARPNGHSSTVDAVTTGRRKTVNIQADHTTNVHVRDTPVGVSAMPVTG